MRETEKKSSVCFRKGQYDKAKEKKANVICTGI